MNWQAKTMKEEFDRKPGVAPAAWKYGIGWLDGPLQTNPHQTSSSSDRLRVAHGRTGASPVPVEPDVAEIFSRALDEPAWLPQSRADARRQPAGDVALGARRIGTRRPDGDSGESRSCRSRCSASTEIDATINNEHMLQRIHTWVATRCSAT